MRLTRNVLIAACLWIISSSCVFAQRPENLPQVLDYIHNGWDVLTRSMQTCDTVIDKRAPGTFCPLPSCQITPESAQSKNLSAAARSA